MARTLLFDARHNQCRTPLWSDKDRPTVETMFVCGAPSLPGKSYCAGCREVLVAGEMRPGGRIQWFAASGRPEALGQTKALPGAPLRKAA